MPALYFQIATVLTSGSGRILIAVLIPLLVACSAQSPTQPPPDIQATVTAMVESLPTPTPEPLPTHTPYPTPEPLPTQTPYPTPRPVIQTVVKQDNWKATRLNDDGRPSHYAVLSQSGRVLVVGCINNGELTGWLWDIYGNLFSDAVDAEYHTESLLVSFDGDDREQLWGYFPAGLGSTDFYSANRPENLIKRLLKAEEVTFNIPTDRADYVITFDVAGLDRHIKQPQDLCE